MPTQVPIGSMRGSLDFTAIFAREPGSRAAALISSRPSSSSGTSSSNSLIRNSGAVRDKISCGPRLAAVDLPDERAHAVADAQVFLRDHLVARQHRFERPGFDDRVAAFHALDDAGDQMFFARQKIVQDLLALGVADLLQDDLLGGLRADAAEFDALERLFDVIRRPCVSGLLSSASCSLYLPRRHFEFLVGHDLPAAERSEIAGRRDRLTARTSTSSLKRFLVAEASASSSAPNTMSLSTFFSRASASTSSNNSRLILGSPVKYSAPDVLFRYCKLEQRHLPSTSSSTFPSLHCAQHPHEIPLPFDRHAQLHARLLPGEPHKIRAPSQRPVQPRRRNFQPVVIHAFDRQAPAQMIADRRAVIDVDAARLVDENAQQAALARALQVDQLVAEPAHRRFQQLLEIHANSFATNKKWAAAHLVHHPAVFNKMRV